MYVCSGGEEKRERKNEMGEGGCICVVREKKKERQRGYMGGGGRKKKGEIKWKKEMGSGIYVYGGKKGGVEKKEKKN